MTGNEQKALERIKDRLAQGIITAAEANVDTVRAHRFMIVKNSLPNHVRKALNSAVKSGQLAHMKRDGRKPECYCHPDFDFLAREERNKIERETNNAVMSICC